MSYYIKTDVPLKVSETVDIDYPGSCGGAAIQPVPAAAIQPVPAWKDGR